MRPIEPLTGHLQTIVPALAGRWGGSPIWDRERVTTPDGDFLDWDWLCGAQSGSVQSPMVVLFHGLEGSSQSHYAKAWGRHATRIGWNLVVVHFRGCSGEINRAPRAYHSGDSAEIDWILKVLRSRFPHRSLVAVGVSLGGNALLRWAGEQGRQAVGRVDALVSVSAPLDLTVCGVALGQGLNRHVYTPYFLKTMIPKAEAKLRQFPGLFDGERMRCSRTLADFDDAFTAPVHGYGTVQRYWREASAKPLIGDIQVPTWIVNAFNDPFVPPSAWPRPEALAPWVETWHPQTGGHVGFTGLSPTDDPNRHRDGLNGALPRAITGWLVERLGWSHPKEHAHG